MRDFKRYLQTIVDHMGYDINIYGSDEIVTMDKKTETYISVTKNEMCLILSKYRKKSIRKINIRDWSDDNQRTIEFNFLIQNKNQECNVSINVHSNNTIDVKYYYGDTIMMIETDTAKLVMRNNKPDERIIPINDLDSYDVYNDIVDAVKKAYSTVSWINNVSIFFDIIKNALFMCLNDLIKNWENSLPNEAKRLTAAIEAKNQEIEQLLKESLLDNTDAKDREYNEAVRERKGLLSELVEVRDAIKYIRDKDPTVLDSYLIETMSGYRR